MCSGPSSAKWLPSIALSQDLAWPVHTPNQEPLSHERAARGREKMKVIKRTLICYNWHSKDLEKGHQEGKCSFSHRTLCRALGLPSCDPATFHNRHRFRAAGQKLTPTPKHFSGSQPGENIFMKLHIFIKTFYLTGNPRHVFGLSSPGNLEILNPNC